MVLGLSEVHRISPISPVAVASRGDDGDDKFTGRSHVNDEGVAFVPSHLEEQNKNPKGFL